MSRSSKILEAMDNDPDDKKGDTDSPFIVNIKIKKLKKDKPDGWEDKVKELEKELKEPADDKGSKAKKAMG